jgi:MFS family permease
LILFHFITFSYPFLPHNVALTSELNITDDAIGCNSDRFEWCYGLTSVNIWLFYGSYALIIGLSFPVLTLTLNSLFSKIIGPRHQGKQHGLLQVSSGVARMAGPAIASILYSGYGPRPVWIMATLVITLTLSTWTVFYKRMVPLKMPERAEINSISPPITNDSKASKSKVHPV